jgi:hypothetical protein
MKSAMSVSLPLSGPGTRLRFKADGASCGWNRPDAALKRQGPHPFCELDLLTDWGYRPICVELSRL